MSTLPSSGAWPPYARLRQHIQVNHGTFRGWVRHGLAQAEYLSGRLEPWTQADPARVQRLVFVCLGNINRSAFGAALARTLGLETASVGLATHTGARATPQAIAQAARQGVDLSAHRATDIGDYEARPGDLLLAMEVRHVHRLIAQGVAPGSIALLGHWATPRRIHLHDPHTLSSAYFSTCFTLIDSAVRHLAACDLARRGGAAR